MTYSQFIKFNGSGNIEVSTISTELEKLQKKVDILEKVIRSSPELNREYEKLMMVDVLIGDEK